MNSNAVATSAALPIITSTAIKTNPVRGVATGLFIAPPLGAARRLFLRGWLALIAQCPFHVLSVSVRDHEYPQSVRPRLIIIAKITLARVSPLIERPGARCRLLRQRRVVFGGKTAHFLALGSGRPKPY